MIRRRRFSDHPRAVGDARRFVAEVLADQPTSVTETACLLVSELATNAVCHARSEFRVTVELSGRQVRVEVYDIGRGLPKVQAPSPSEPHGRGLQIVGLLADEWGLVEGSRHGKATWFTVGSMRQGRVSVGERHSKEAAEQGSGTSSTYGHA